MKRQRQRFEYRPRDKSAVQRRADQSGGLFDSITRGEFPTWRPKDGVNTVRFLPPTWEDPDHYGLDLYVHYGIGSDEQSYVCLSKMKGEACPCCEQRKAAEKAGDSDYASSLTPSKRVMAWIIDRDDEKAGPQLWVMGWSVDRDIATLTIDKRTGKTLFIDSPDEGFDVEFTKKGQKLRTKYLGIQIARNASPLSDDEDTQSEWLQYVTDHPLPEVIQYFNYDHIAAAASGRPTRDEDEDDDDDPKPAKTKNRRSVDDDDDDEEAPKPRKAKKPSVDDDDADEDEELPPPKKRASKPALDDDDDEEPPKPRKAKRPPVDEDDDEDKPRPTKKATQTSTTKSRSDDDDEDFDCVACSDTGRNSKGGFCVCAKGRKLKARAAAAEADDDDE